MRRILTTTTALLLLTGCATGNNQETNDAFTVGMECNYAPFNWTTLEANEHTVQLTEVDYCDGYDVVMAQDIANHLGLELEIKKIAWNGLEPALNTGEIDAIIAGMTATPSREENADFTNPYYESEMVIIVRNDSELTSITNIQELSGYTVQGQINTTYDEVITQIEGVNHATPLDTYPLMVVALQDQAVDALVAEMPVAKGIISSNPDLAIVTFEKEAGFVADTSVSVAVASGNTELLNSINEYLDTVDQETRNNIMLESVNRQPAGE